jgi:hypothetical protein
VSIGYLITGYLNPLVRFVLKKIQNTVNVAGNYGMLHQKLCFDIIHTLLSKGF